MISCRIGPCVMIYEVNITVINRLRLNIFSSAPTSLSFSLEILIQVKVNQKGFESGATGGLKNLQPSPVAPDSKPFCITFIIHIHQTHCINVRQFLMVNNTNLCCGNSVN